MWQGIAKGRNLPPSIFKKLKARHNTVVEEALLETMALAAPEGTVAPVNEFKKRTR